MKLKLMIMLGLTLAPVIEAAADVFYTVEQARYELWQDTPMQRVAIRLTDAEEEAIENASQIRVLTKEVNAWKTEDGGWFLVDQVIGKHEMIDVAVAINKDGTIKDLRVMKYVESYGDEVKHPLWLAQFHGRDTAEHLKLDKQIDNISGATLSCRHITDGVNRWVHTWDQVLKHK